MHDVIIIIIIIIDYINIYVFCFYLHKDANAQFRHVYMPICKLPAMEAWLITIIIYIRAGTNFPPPILNPPPHSKFQFVHSVLQHGITFPSVGQKYMSNQIIHVKSTALLFSWSCSQRSWQHR